MVSSTHFEIKLLFFTFQITDYSENGTYLNKSRIGKFNTVTLKDGDIIRVYNSDDEVIGFEFKCGSCL
jgi:pSer/pThr/pTyr-binding forkhead associated (FHA) protein